MLRQPSKGHRASSTRTELGAMYAGPPPLLYLTRLALLQPNICITLYDTQAASVDFSILIQCSTNEDVPQSLNTCDLSFKTTNNVMCETILGTRNFLLCLPTIPSFTTHHNMHLLCYGRLALGIAIPTIAVMITPKDSEKQRNPTTRTTKPEG